MEGKRILEVKDIKLYFPIQKNIFGKVKQNLKAVDGISFNLDEGETIGIVGESGCGKTTLGRTILQLYKPTAGKALYFGRDVKDFLPKYYVDTIKKVTLNKTIKDVLYKDDEIIKIGDKEYFSNDCSVLGGLLLSDDLNAIKKALLKQISLYKTIKKMEVKLIDLSYKEQKEEQIAKLKTKLDNNKKEYELVLDSINKVKEEIKSKQEDLFNELESKKENGINLAKLKAKEMRKLRVDIQLVFQDPYSSLPPRMTIGSIISEAVKVHHIVPKNEVYDYVIGIMKQCGLQEQFYERYPHEFSGGQRQRICIARALAVKPKLIVCDEPVSALDVSIQAQIINLLKKLQKDLGLTYIFISHDLSVVKYITNKILVMYLGNLMEYAATEELFKNPKHPYTKALFSAVPNPDPDAKMNRIILSGDIPSPANPPKGCKFHTRCKEVMTLCEFLEPKHVKINEKHVACCHLCDEEILKQRKELEEKYEEEQAKLVSEESSMIEDEKAKD